MPGDTSLSAAIFGTAALSQLLLPASSAFLMASMGASTVILLILPSSPVAQPWPLLSDHFSSTGNQSCHWSVRIADVSSALPTSGNPPILKPKLKVEVSVQLLVSALSQPTQR